MERRRAKRISSCSSEPKERSDGNSRKLSPGHPINDVKPYKHPEEPLNEWPEGQQVKERDKRRFQAERARAPSVWPFNHVSSASSVLGRANKCPAFLILIHLSLILIVIKLSSTSAHDQLGSASLASMASSAGSLLNGDDEELSKTMEGAGEANELAAPTLELQQQEQRQEVRSGAGGSTLMSIWTPTDGHQHDDSLNGLSSSDLIRHSKSDEDEFGGQAEQSEFTRQFVSVLNNQSNIVLSTSSNGTRPGAAEQLATSFLLRGQQPAAAVSGQTNRSAPVASELASASGPGTRFIDTSSPLPGPGAASGGQPQQVLATSESRTNATTTLASVGEATTRPAPSADGDPNAAATDDRNHHKTHQRKASKEFGGRKKKKAKEKLKSSQVAHIKFTKSKSNLDSKPFKLPGASVALVAWPNKAERMITYSAVTTTRRPTRKAQDFGQHLMQSATSMPDRSIAVLPPAALLGASKQNGKPDSHRSLSTFFALPSGGHHQLNLAASSSPLASLSSLGEGRYLSPGASGQGQAEGNEQQQFIFDTSAGRLPGASAALSHLFSHTSGSSLSSLLGSLPKVGAYQANSDKALRSAAHARQQQQQQHQQQVAAMKLGEFLITSSSHPSNEFETTLKQVPEQQQDPIVTQDTSAEASASSGESNSPPVAAPSVVAPQSAQAPNGDNNNDDDDDDDLDDGADGADTSGATAASNDQGSNGTSGRLAPLLEPPSSEMASVKGGAAAGSDHGHDDGPEESTSLDAGGGGKPTRLDAKERGSKEAAGRATPAAADTELLVGPFKSESEAPATITLSGVVYQKSGASSPFVAPPRAAQMEPGERDNISASGSQSSSSTSSGGDQSGKLTGKGQSGNDFSKYWPYTATPSSYPGFLASSGGSASSSSGPQLGSINEILLGTGFKGSQLGSSSADSLASLAQQSQLTESSSSSSPLAFHLPDSWLGMSGGIRLGPFPFSPSSLFSGSFGLPFGSAASHLTSQQLEELNQQAKQMATSSATAQAAKQSQASNGKEQSVLGSVLDFASLAASQSSPIGSSLSAEQAQQASQIWAGTGTGGTGGTGGPGGPGIGMGSKKGQGLASESFYMAGPLSGAASDTSLYQQSASSNKHQKDKGPIVIVQKDVKPVKYHLMRAYLKLRRLLRPFEATYVFLNDRHGNLAKRRQQINNRPAGKKASGEVARRGRVIGR